MNRRKKYVITASALATLVITLAAPLPIDAAPPDRDVRVINTAAEAVPVTGNVSVSGSVSVSNTPTVNLGAGSSVAINNTNANPVPVFNTNASDAFTPFQAVANSTQSGNNVSTVTVATVPAGKLLIIEYVSMAAQVPPGQHAEIMEITTSAGLGGISFPFVIHAQPAAVIGDSLFRTNQDLRLYAAAGTTVSALFRRSSGAGTATYQVAISGRLVNQ